MTLKEIDEEIERLTRLRDVERDKEIAKRKKAAEKNVGRCFKSDGVYFKVVGIPTENYPITGISFNPYQYPALYCYETIPYDMPFEIDTVFSGVWGEGHGTVDREYEEITREEFNEEFEKRIQEFRKRVMEI